MCFSPYIYKSYVTSLMQILRGEAIKVLDRCYSRDRIYQKNFFLCLFSLGAGYSQAIVLTIIWPMLRECRKPGFEESRRINTMKMKALKLMVSILGASLIIQTTCAQESGKIKPFSISIGSVTVTGTYSEGRLYRNTVNGTSILWGLITWGGSQVIDCRPGNEICIFEMSVSVGFRGFRTNERGEKGLELVETPGNTYPVLINTDGRDITFAVDIEQVSSEKKALYLESEWKLENDFVLAPNIVKQLNLYDGKGEMGFVIPAGTYPLKRDGNIRYWTWQRPK